MMKRKSQLCVIISDGNCKICVKKKKDLFIFLVNCTFSCQFLVNAEAVSVYKCSNMSAVGLIANKTNEM